MAAPTPGPKKSARKKAAPLIEPTPDPANEGRARIALSADSRDRTGPWRPREPAESEKERAARERREAAREASRRRAHPDFDPIAEVRGSSVRIEEILKFKWGRGGHPFVSANVAALLKGATVYARADAPPEASPQVRPRHLWRALLAKAFVAEGGGFAGLLRIADKKRGLFARLLASEKHAEDLAAAGSPPPAKAGDLLHWESVEIFARASELRRATNTRHRDLGQRHLALALFMTKEGQTALRDMGGFSSGYEPLRSVLIACCPSDNFSQLGDSGEAWKKIFAELGDAQPLVDRIERRPDYLNDRVRAGAPGQGHGEPLGAAEDARALADLMLLEAAEPPIAIGLFGPWGSGKSTLIEHLKSEICRQTRAERAVRQTARPRDEETRIVGNVVQLSFNAWTFADSSNLWATLTSEIFDQLAAGGWTEAPDENGESQDSDPRTRLAAAALVSEVAARTAREVASLRVARVTVREQDLAIKAAEDVLQKARNQKRASFGHAVTDAAGDLARDGETFKGGEDLRRLLTWSLARGWKRAVLVALAVAALGSLVYAAILNLPSLSAISSSLVAALSVAGTVTALAWPILRALASFAHHWGSRKLAADQAIARASADVQERTTALAAAEQERARSESFLTTYKMDGAGSITTAPMKMLDYLLKESETVAAIRAQTGLLATVRRCFEQLQTVIRNARRRKAPDAIDRIILYIDDLDRCSTRQVSDILQAVHLLLSFDCFVVVVAADANWLKQSLEKEHSQLFEGKDGKEGKLTPADYLEKIFQIPFWVKPLVDVDAKPENRFRLYETYVDHLLRDEDSAAAQIPSLQEGKPAETGHAAGPALSFRAEKPTREEDPGAPRRERIRLSQPEKSVLKQLGPLAAKSPRAVKRMINIYRLIRVRLEETELEAFLGNGSEEVPSFRAVLFALACEVGLPPTAMTQVGRALGEMSPTIWTMMRAKTNPAEPARRLAAANEPLYDALDAVGRVQDFILAQAVIEKIADPRQIHMGLEEVRRYSFRPL